MIPGLKVGEAIITGEAVNYPILLRVRERRSKLVEKGMKLEEEILKFSNSLKFKEDMEAFVSFK
jgi:DNA helicase HerA-like ATPase